MLGNSLPVAIFSIFIIKLWIERVYMNTLDEINDDDKYLNKNNDQDNVI